MLLSRLDKVGEGGVRVGVGVGVGGVVDAPLAFVFPPAPTTLVDRARARSARKSSGQPYPNASKTEIAKAKGGGACTGNHAAAFDGAGASASKYPPESDLSDLPFPPKPPHQILAHVKLYQAAYGLSNGRRFAGWLQQHLQSQAYLQSLHTTSFHLQSDVATAATGHDSDSEFEGEFVVSSLKD